MKKFKYLIIIIFLFGFITNVSADELVRNEANNYGVKKRIKINSNNKSNVLKTPYVDASLSIYDYADILSDLEKEKFKEHIDKIKNQYNIDVVIYTVNEYVSEKTNEVIATDFYDYNDFGMSSDNYDGVLIYRNANKSSPYYGIYTFGESQLYMSELTVEDTLDYVYSFMIKGNYGLAFNRMLNDIEEAHKNGIDYSMKNAYIDKNGFIKYKYRPPYFLALIVSLIVSSVVVSTMMAKNKMVKKAKRAEIYLDLDTVNFTKKENTFENTRTTSYTISSSSSSSGGSSHSSSRSHSSSGSSGRGHSGGGRRG